MSDLNPNTEWHFHPNKTSASFHGRRKLPFLSHFRLSSDDNVAVEDKRLHDTISAIRGVTEVSFINYEIIVKKGKMFDWSEIVPQVEYAYSVYVADDVPAITPLADAAEALHISLKDSEGYLSIGVAEGDNPRLYVYASNDNIDNVPNEYGGFPVMLRVTGVPHAAVFQDERDKGNGDD